MKKLFIVIFGIIIFGLAIFFLPSKADAQTTSYTTTGIWQWKLLDENVGATSTDIPYNVQSSNSYDNPVEALKVQIPVGSVNTIKNSPFVYFKTSSAITGFTPTFQYQTSSGTWSNIAPSSYNFIWAGNLPANYPFYIKTQIPFYYSVGTKVTYRMAFISDQGTTYTPAFYFIVGGVNMNFTSSVVNGDTYINWDAKIVGLPTNTNIRWSNNSQNQQCPIIPIADGINDLGAWNITPSWSAKGCYANFPIKGSVNLGYMPQSMFLTAVALVHLKNDPYDYRYPITPPLPYPEGSEVHNYYAYDRQGIQLGGTGGTCIPTVTASITDNYTQPGTISTVQFEVTNNKTVTATFKFSSNLPSNWNTTFSPADLFNIGPGAKRLFSMTFTPPIGATGTQNLAITVAEMLGGAPVSGCLATSNVLTLSLNPPQLLTDLRIDEATITEGQNSTISWTVENAQTCIWSGTLAGIMPPIQIPSESNSKVVSPPASRDKYTLVLTCNSGTMNSNDSVDLTVNAKPLTVTLGVSPSNVDLNVLSNIQWGVENAKSCTTSGFTPSIPILGTVNGSMPANTTVAGTQSFKLDCVDSLDALLSRTATLTVNSAPVPPAAPTVEISANPTSINEGETNPSLSITLSGGPIDSCSWTAGDPGFAAPTTTTVLPISASLVGGNTYTYTLQCTGPGGVGSDSATVTVNNVIPKSVVVHIFWEDFGVEQSYKLKTLLKDIK